MELVKKSIGKWIQAAIIMVVGILCIVAGAAIGNQNGSAAQDSLNAISVTLGIVLIVVGALALVIAIVASVLVKKGFAAVALPGGVLVALGISLVAAKYAGSLIGIVITVIPYLLLVIGAILLGDAIYSLVKAVKAKCVKSALAAIIFAMIVASVAIVIGSLCVGDNPVIAQNIQLIVFGIILVVVAILQVVLTLVKLPDNVVAIVSIKDEK